MILFHGSDTLVDNPVIMPKYRSLDFGLGFYVTSSHEQAVSWAKKVCYRNASKHQYVNSYEFDHESAISTLKVKKFDKADEEWLDYVCACRMNRPVDEYDIVIGPVADDTVYSVVILYENGDLDKQEALKRLKVENLKDQILFHTEESLKYLKYNGTEEVL